MGHWVGGMQGAPMIRGAPMGHGGGMQGAPMIREASCGAQGGGDAGSPYDQRSLLWGTR